MTRRVARADSERLSRSPHDSSPGASRPIESVGRQDSAVLLERARAGSAEALDVLFDRHAARLLALVRLRMGASLRAHLESRDVLQTTLLKAFRAIGQFSGSSSGSLMAWLSRIAQNEIRDLADYYHRPRRDADRCQPLTSDLPEGLVRRVRSETSRILLDEKMLSLERALEALDSVHREVIVLRKLEELSFPDVAERMGRSPDACRMLLARAMAALTLRMETVP